MAEPSTGFFSAIGNFLKLNLQQIPQDVLSSLFWHNVFSWVTGRTRASHEANAPMIHIRGQMLSEILTGGATGGRLDNLWRRHRVALEDTSHPFREDREIRLLANIPDSVRPGMLRVLDGMPDEGYNQAIEYLRHNNLLSFCQLVAIHAGPVAQEAWRVFSGKMGELNTWLERVGEDPTAPSWGKVARRLSFSVLLGAVVIPGLLLYSLFLGFGLSTLPPVLPILKWVGIGAGVAVCLWAGIRYARPFGRRIASLETSLLIRYALSLVTLGVLVVLTLISLKLLNVI